MSANNTLAVVRRMREKGLPQVGEGRRNGEGRMREKGIPHVVRGGGMGRGG